MRILSNLTLAAAILAGGALLIPAVANAEDHSVSPVGFGELLVGCTSAGGEFGSAGSMYWCTVHDCDGDGSDCSVGCSDEAGIETCTGSTPKLIPAGHKFQRLFLRSLGTRYLPASQGDTGTPNHTAQAAVPAAAVGNTTVIY